MIKVLLISGLVFLATSFSAAEFGKTALIIPHRTSEQVTADKHPVPTRRKSDADDSINRLIKNLHDPNSAVTARTELIVAAKLSHESRTRVIHLLINDANNQPELDGRHVVLSGETFDYWFQSTQVLAELKATESIDLLIRCIYAGNGLTGSMGHRPAFSALVQIGAPAVPKLSAALLASNDEYARPQVAICLGTIGGRDAERALTRALRKESSNDVIRYIRRGLDMIRGVESTPDLMTLP